MGLAVQAEEIAPSSVASGQLLTFIVGSSAYAIDILAVQEIRGWEGATRIPNAPAHLQGVIDLRGSTIPVMDLRERLGVKQGDAAAAPVMIVAGDPAAGRDQLCGLIVDRVCDVQTVTADDWRALPAHLEQGEGCVAGLVCIDEQLTIILDLARLLRSPESIRKGEQH